MRALGIRVRPIEQKQQQIPTREHPKDRNGLGFAGGVVTGKRRVLDGHRKERCGSTSELIGNEI